VRIAGTAPTEYVVRTDYEECVAGSDRQQCQTTQYEAAPRKIRDVQARRRELHWRQ